MADITPVTRAEKILAGEDIVPVTRFEKLLKELVDSGGGGGGGESTIAWKPKVAEDGTITWTRTASTTAPAAQNIKGEKGDKGDKGDTGTKGEDGAQGQDGAKGDKGDDGYSPTIAVTEITGGHRVTVTDATGSQSFDVMDGQGGSGGDTKAFIAEYNVTTAQEINAFIDSANEPFPPMVIKRGNDYYTCITAQKQADNKVIIRSFATLSGDYYVFMYTITDGSWASLNYPFQKKGDAYTKAETDALLTNKAAQSSVVALQDTTESLRLANEATEAELTDFKSDIAIDLGGIVERLGEDESAISAKQDKPVYVVDKPEGTSPVSGNVMQVGNFVDTDGTEYGIYEFYYKTSALPAADTTKTYSFSPLLDDYTIFDFIDQSGITSNGHVISSGRTDGTNRVIIQQFSKNNKNVMIRAYGDYTAQTALLRIKFIGAKTV